MTSYLNIMPEQRAPVPPAPAENLQSAAVEPPSSVLALRPFALLSRAGDSASGRRSSFALVLVVLVHIGAIAWMLSAPKPIPLEKLDPLPITVSLISAPLKEPEVVPLLPEPPKPQPVIKKQKPLPQPKDIKPTPRPIEQASPAVEQTAVPVASTPTPVEVAKAPEIKPEPVKPEVKDVIEEPKFGVSYLNNPAPAYPAMSRRIGEQGRVIMRVLVSANGDPESVKVENSSGSNRLDDAAVEAVKKWRFVPAKKNKQAISAYVLVPIKFSLDDA